MLLSEIKQIYDGKNYSELEIKYSPIPHMQKFELIKAILIQCISVENNIKVIDNFLFELLNKLYIFGAYTGIEYDGGIPNNEIYNYLISSNLYKDFEKDIDDENYFYDYGIFQELLYKELHSEVNDYNSLSFVVARGVETLVKKIPDSKEINKLVNKLPKALNAVDPETRTFLVDLFSKKAFVEDVQKSVKK